MTLLRINPKRAKADKVIFIICLTIALTLGIASFLLPPTGEISASVIGFVAELIAFATIAVGAQAIADGRAATLKHGETEITINDETPDSEGQ